MLVKRVASSSRRFGRPPTRLLLHEKRVVTGPSPIETKLDEVLVQLKGARKELDGIRSEVDSSFYILLIGCWVIYGSAKLDRCKHRL